MVSTIVLCILFIVIVLNKTNKSVAIIKSGHIKGISNKTVGELIKIISYNEDKWMEMGSGGDKKEIFVMAHWTNQYGKDTKFLFKLSNGSEFVRLVDIYFDDLSQGWMKMAFFWIFSAALIKGKSLRNL